MMFGRQSLSLPRFVTEHSKLLPLKIEVQTGYCGENNQLSISTKDLFNVHFIKHAEVVQVKPQSGQPLNLPLNLDIQFSLLYDPKNDQEEALKGFVFAKVSNLMALDKIPKVFCSTKCWKSPNNNPNCDVWQGEVFIFIEIVKSSSKKSLKVFSLKMNEMKILCKDCEGNFSTKPDLCPLHLLEMKTHIPNLFPSKAQVYKSTEGVLSHLTSTIYTLLGTATETTLVASAVKLSDDDLTAKYIPAADELIEIPIDLPEVEVAVLDCIDENEYLRLCAKTKEILDSFNPSMVRSFSDTYDVLRGSSLRKGFEKAGIEFDASSNIYDVPSAVLPTFKTPKKYQKSLSETSISKRKTPVPVVPLHDSSMSHPHATSLKNELSEMKCLMMDLEKRVKQLEAKDYLEMLPQAAARSQTKRDISIFTPKEVTVLLESMGLQQYKEVFEKEQINGEVLIELDEDILKEELGVSSRVHRIRLMKVINNRYTQ